MRKMFLVLACLLVSQMSYADLSFDEQESLHACAEQFEMMTADELGEATGMSLILGSKDSVRVFALTQGEELRGLLQIDTQGDVTEVDSKGQFLRMCQ